MNCDGIARWYQALEYLAFGRALGRRRFQYIDEIAGARSVLILGDGDGRFTAEFVRQNPAAKVDSVDLSIRMIEMAKGRVSDAANVRFRMGDARTIALERKYDLVVTHFFLDCFTGGDLNLLIARVTECCEPEARWLVSEFGSPEKGMGRIAAKIVIRLLYFCFRLATGLKVTQLPDYGLLLTRNGFHVSSRSTAIGGLLVSELWTSADQGS
jgi:ubiquinone/menaquinone biosynthesis C-methylase UbiE